MLEELTIGILAERKFATFDSKKLVDWAINVLEGGYESENLYILAGLDYETTEEREKYFWKSVLDLMLDIQKNDDELLEKYAILIANKAIRKEISIDYAFRQMLEIVSASEYDDRYISFYEINEDLDYLAYCNSTLFNSGLTLENSKELILKELKIFSQIECLKIPKKEQNKCYCETCKRLNEPVTKNKYQFRKPFKYMIWVCSLCGSERLRFNNNQNVKRMIIEEYRQKGFDKTA